MKMPAGIKLRFGVKPPFGIKPPMGLSEIKERGKELTRVCAPITVEQAGVMFMGLISVWLVNTVGEYAVTAVGMVDSISNFIISLFAAMTTGGTIVVSRFIGARRLGRAASAAAQTLMLSVFFGVIISVVFFFLRTPILGALFGKADASVMKAANTFFLITLISYPPCAVFQTVFGCLRGGGNTRAPMMISLIMNVLNLVLGILLVRGFRLGGFWLHPQGVGGVAAALLVSRCVGCAVSLVYIFKLNNAFKLSLRRDFGLYFKLQKSILAIGVPTSVESALFNLGKLLTMTFIVAMGKEAATANSIGSSVAGFINIPGNAISIGVMIIIGGRIGAGKLDDVRRSAMFTIAASSALMTVVCLICLIFNSQIVGAYHLTSGTASALSSLMLLYYATVPFFWSVSFVTPSALRSCGDTKYTMYIAIISMWTIRIFLGYFLGITLKLGIMGVWIAMVADWALRGGFFMRRLARGGWRKRANDKV